MTTVFTYLNNILSLKDRNSLVCYDDYESYIPYMIARWISFYSPGNAKIINNTVNRYWPILQNKDDHYKLLFGIISQQSNRRIAYIKKVKPDEKEKDNSKIIKLLADNLQISTREINEYIEQCELDIDSMSKILNKK